MDSRDGIEVVGLRRRAGQHVGLGLVDRRDGLDGHARGGQRVERGLERRQPVADVGAEGEEDASRQKPLALTTG